MSCSKCKKKKPVTELPPVVEEIELVGFIPTKDDIVMAYAELTNYNGVNENKRDFINTIYKYLFNEDFDFNCGGCASSQARKFKNYINNELKINL